VVQPILKACGNPTEIVDCDKISTFPTLTFVIDGVSMTLEPSFYIIKETI
jgi:Eukaryotic aspartyl protease